MQNIDELIYKAVPDNILLDRELKLDEPLGIDVPIIVEVEILARVKLSVLS